MFFGDDDDAVEVGEDQVARLDPDAADFDRAAVCFDLGAHRGILGEAAAGEDRPALFEHLGGVAVEAVDDGAVGAAGAGGGGENLAPIGAAHIATAGQKDVSAAAKSLKTFAADNDKLKIKFGYLNNNRMEKADLMTLADLPSIEVLRSKILGVINAPATKLVVLLNTPASQLARVIKAKSELAA